MDSQCVLAVEFLVQTKIHYGTLIDTTDDVRNAVREKALSTSPWASPLCCGVARWNPPESLQAQCGTRLLTLISAASPHTDVDGLWNF